MKKLILVLLLLFPLISFSQLKVGSGLTVVHFNAGWNSANNVKWFGGLSDAKIKRCDIVADADGKRKIYGFQATDMTNQYQANNTGFIDQLFFDGIEGTSVGDNPDSNYEYNWSSSTDSVQVFISTADPNDMIIDYNIADINIGQKLKVEILGHRIKFRNEKIQVVCKIV